MKEKGWKDIPLGGLILEPGNAKEYFTGSWRTFRPLLDEKKCKHCLICWIYCPDSSIIVVDEKMEGFRYDYCKGCGICATECPFDAIKMIEEAKYRTEKGGEK